MRLTATERTTIARAAAAVFGSDVRVLLFGSRTDDNARGGDIDLFVGGVAASALQVQHLRLALLGRLHDELGDQRIDLVVQRADGPVLAIHRAARLTGIDVTA